MNAMQRLNELIREKNSRICAGLDPNWEEILRLRKCEGTPFRPYILAKYCSDYIDSIYDIVPAIKINIAPFEKMQCLDIYYEAASYAKGKGLFVIGDVKRADIGSTSAAYADAYLRKSSPFDAITINPYFGMDGVMPFFKLAKENGKGVFVLVKTSNKSSAEIQDLELRDGRKVYEAVMDLLLDWAEEVDKENFGGGLFSKNYPIVGAVVGATHKEQAERLKWRMGRASLLVPGYGAQGATADDVACLFDEQGIGTIVNSSRGIMQAYKSEHWKEQYSEETWTEAARAEAIRATQEINHAINARFGKNVCIES